MLKFILMFKLLVKYVDNTPVKSIVVNISAGTTGFYSSPDLLNDAFVVTDGSLNVVLPEIPFNAESITLRVSNSKNVLIFNVCYFKMTFLYHAVQCQINLVIAAEIS